MIFGWFLPTLGRVTPEAIRPGWQWSDRLRSGWLSGVHTPRRCRIGRIVYSLWPGLPGRGTVRGVGVDGRISYDYYQQIAALGREPMNWNGRRTSALVGVPRSAQTSNW